MSDPSLTPAPPARVDWQLIPWSIAALCAGLATAAVWHTATSKPPDPPPVARLELRTAPGTTFDREAAPIAISPDGRSFAWSACDGATDRCALYVRAIDRFDAQALAGTDGAHAPTFSPDGRWIAFFADGALKKIAAGGGAPTPLAAAPDPGGAAWTADGRIVFAASTAGGLSIVDDQGGRAQTLTAPSAGRGELRHRFPAVVPASHGLIFTIASDPDPEAPDTLAALAPDSGGVRVLRRDVRRALPAGIGYLLLSAGSDLQAATFDTRTLVLTGPTDAVAAPPAEGAPEFAVGGNALAIVRGSARPSRVWSDGADAGPLSRLRAIAIAPDSRRAAGIDASGDVWMVDLGAGAPTRLTFGGLNASPAWAADGSRLFFSTRDPDGPYRVVSRSASERSEAPVAVRGLPPQAFPTSIAADGRIALTVFHDGHASVGVAAPDGSPPRILTDGPFDESAPAFSPDGRWLALESTASGRREVVVRSTTDGRRIALTSDGGSKPHWTADGRAIYFTSGRRLLCVPFAGDGSAAASPAQAVLDRAGERPLAVTPAGRVLIERHPDADSAIVVLQWLRELGERLPLPVNPPR